MAMDRPDSRPSGNPGGDAVLIELRKSQTDRRSAPDARAAAALSAMTEQQQLARDIDDIERASAALRRAEPALESWTDPPPATTAQKPRPVWLLIGLLWLSTALVTVGAVAAIAALVG
jgi:hypothetical protein